MGFWPQIIRSSFRLAFCKVRNDQPADYDPMARCGRIGKLCRGPWRHTRRVLLPLRQILCRSRLGTDDLQADPQRDVFGSYTVIYVPRISLRLGVLNFSFLGIYYRRIFVLHFPQDTLTYETQ
jgi:hypothetical protein